MKLLCIFCHVNNKISLASRKNRSELRERMRSTCKWTERYEVHYWKK